MDEEEALRHDLGRLKAKAREYPEPLRPAIQAEIDRLEALWLEVEQKKREHAELVDETRRLRMALGLL